MSSREEIISHAIPISSSESSSASSFIYPRVIEWQNLTSDRKYKSGSNIEFTVELDFINEQQQQDGTTRSDDEFDQLASSFPEDEIVISVTLERLSGDEEYGGNNIIAEKRYSSYFQQVDVSELEIDGVTRSVASKEIPIMITIPDKIKDLLADDCNVAVCCQVVIGENKKFVNGFPMNINCGVKRKPMLGFDTLYCTSETSKDSSFAYPLDVTLYHERNIFYVTDTYNRRIAVFELGTRQFKFHISLSSYPRCLVVSEVDDSIIFTCDDNYVYKYSYDGSKLIWKSYPNLNWARGLVIDTTNEDIYICDFDNHRIVVLSKNGDFLRDFGSKGSGDTQFDGPKDIDFDLDGNLVVSDRENHRILVLSKLNGSLIRKIENGHGNQPGQFACQEGFCIDRTNGNIIVCDSMNDRIQIFNSKLQFITSFGEAGIEKSELTKPTGCALDEKRQELLVVEWNNQRLQVFRYPLLSKNVKLIKTKLLRSLHNGTLSDVQINTTEMD
ncbi:predicted protein [Naegleria gruberi]|uniref:Predicted protein n=1 Tax=Naegleria gruberi TaxID=5762 RepID=D2VPW4_NAEGR|nr:uncharacterized protein NAEGRDRAFT_71009 [Naegleria gruberi]EFC41276.1 predicted protein [Naegleria gruberi]|eukprot:XP_002674020.1 predicted protein [Naegleria gruberi strain NEG-M]